MKTLLLIPLLLSLALALNLKLKQIHKVRNRNTLFPNTTEIEDELAKLNSTLTNSSLFWNNYTFISPNNNQTFYVININEVSRNETLTHRLKIYVNSTADYANATFIYEPVRNNFKRMEWILQSKRNE